MKITKLRIEYLENPIGVGELRPRMSWLTQTDEKDWMQGAYQICVTATEQALNGTQDDLIWDSGKISGEESVHVEYDGPALKSEQRLWWKVRVWNQEDQVSEWSDVSFWQMGLLNEQDWNAKWIGSGVEENSEGPYPPHYLRKKFQFGIDRLVSKATVHVTAHGLYELYLDGKKIGEDLLTPGWTSYQERLQVQSYDVSDLLHGSGHCLGGILGDGWYRGPFTWQLRSNIYGEKTALLCQMHIEFEDGTEQWILSDETWQCRTGPIRKSEIYDGEVYDARLELMAWCSAENASEGWSDCIELSKGLQTLVAPCSEPVKVTERVVAKEIIRTPKGEFVLDFAQNLVGWVSFALKGESGQRIVIDHAEVLDADGNFYTDNLRTAQQRIEYVFKGSDHIERYRPHFTFMGFRYIRITEYENPIRAEDFVAEVFHSDMEPTGQFECSDPLVTQLQSNIQWGLRGNFVDVPTDCPQRDERMGWTGDAQVFTPTACFNVNAAPFFTKWLKDLAVEQRDDGSVPWVVPNVVEDGGGTGWSDGFGSTAWSDVAVLMPFELYKRYGDLRVLRNQYASMKAWVDYMIYHSGERCIFDYGFHFGDWLSFAEYMSYDYGAPDYGFAGAHTDKDLIATAYFYHSTNVLSQTAKLLKRDADAKRYSELLPRIRQAFVNEFVTESGRLSSNTQTAYAVAVAFDVLPAEYRESAKRRIVKDIQHLGHLTTGFVGTPILSNTLTEMGCEEEAFQLLFNKRYPSWLFPVTKGATTIWERWDGIKPDGSFQTVGMNSFNHYAYGSVGDWLYSHVAGLQLDPENPGYKHFVVKPILTPLLSFVNLSYESMYGEIRIRWELDGSDFSLEVTIPPNTRASVFVPTKPSTSVPIGQYSFSVDYEQVELGSGRHCFESKLR